AEQVAVLGGVRDPGTVLGPGAHTGRGEAGRGAPEHGDLPSLLVAGDRPVRRPDGQVGPPVVVAVAGSEARPEVVVGRRVARNAGRGQAPRGGTRAGCSAPIRYASRSPPRTASARCTRPPRT